MQTPGMPSNNQEIFETIVNHLIDISKGECHITEEMILDNDDENYSGVLSGLLILHETIVFQKEELKRLTAAEAAAESEKKRSDLLHRLNEQLIASEQQQKAANQQLRASEQHLLATNQQLASKEQALRASQHQLVQKINDLERFNKLMVGRENEMIKLKRIINGLLKELGRPLQYETPQKVAVA